VAFCAYRPVEVGDVLTAAPETLDRVFDVSVGGLITVVQSSLADMRESDDASVLVLNGGLGIHDPDIDRAAVSFGGDGVALECAAKSKLAGLLAERLRPEDVFVGELVITGSVKGSPYAGPTSIDPVDIADRLWTMARDRTENRAFIGEQPWRHPLRIGERHENSRHQPLGGSDRWTARDPGFATSVPAQRSSALLPSATTARKHRRVQLARGQSGGRHDRGARRPRAPSH
jgi:hypothetical protein